MLHFQLFSVFDYVLVGQAICKRIDVAKKKNSSAVKRVCAQYSKISDHRDNLLPVTVTVDYLYDFAKWRQFLTSPQSAVSDIPMTEQITILTHRHRRAEEEKVLTLIDMNTFYANQLAMYNGLLTRAKELEGPDKYERGELCIVRSAMLNVGQSLVSLATEFADYATFVDVPIVDMTYPVQPAGLYHPTLEEETEVAV